MKRILSLLLVLAFLLPTLVGCPSPDNGGGTTTTTTTTQSQNPPPPEAVALNFSADFTIHGEGAALFEDALEYTKVEPADSTDAAKKIYVGEADADIVAAAKAKLAQRENNYADFVICSNDSELAIYGGSAYATDEAIKYLVNSLVNKKKIAFYANHTYYYEAPISTATIGGVALTKFAVVYDEVEKSVAESFALDLSILTGYEVVATTRSRLDNQIVLSAGGTITASSVADKAHMTYADGKLTVSADNRNTLSYAASYLLGQLRDNATIPADTDSDINLATETYKASDTALFKYCGYWSATDAENPDLMISYWNTAYVEIAFSGNVITVHFDTPTTFESRIDKGDYIKQTNVTSMTFFAEGSGTHVLRIYNATSTVHMRFAGVSAQEDVSVTRAPNKKHYMQIIGASSIDTPYGFARKMAELLDYDYCMTARAGISVQTDPSWWNYDSAAYGYVLGENLGMQDAFWKMGIPDHFAGTLFSTPDSKILTMLNYAVRATSSDPRCNGYTNTAAYINYRNSLSDTDLAKLDAMIAAFKSGDEPQEMKDLKADMATFLEMWNSGKLDADYDSLSYTPDIFYIMLGTNDGVSKTTKDTFVKAYLDFAELLLALYGNDTSICVMNAINVYDKGTDKTRFPALDEVAKKLNGKFPGRAQSISYEQVLQIVEPMNFPDGTHPDEASHTILAEQLALILDGYYN